MTSVSSIDWYQDWRGTNDLAADHHEHHHQVLHTQAETLLPRNNITQSSIVRPYFPVKKNISYYRKPEAFLTYLISLSVVQPQLPHNHIYNTNFGPVERTGPFTTWYQWNLVDFAYASDQERQQAILFEEYIPENNLPLGMAVSRDRIFVSCPKWKTGVPASLTVLPRVPVERSPKLVPYPSWEWHRPETCENIVSVFRMHADSCNRLWVLDSGLVQVTIKPIQLCPPKLLIFDLHTDQLLVRYDLTEFVKENGLFSNIMVDVRGDDCVNVHAYLSDVWRYNLVVFSLRQMRAWLINDHLFYMEPLAAAYKIHHLEFEWTDGLFGIALSPYDPRQPDRTVYFHPMSGFREFRVPSSVILNETGWAGTKNAFQVMGQSRGANGQVSSHAMDRRGILFFNLVTRDSVGCWDSGKPYKRDNLGVVARSSESLMFPNDLKVDDDERQSVWVLSNKLPFYLYEGLDSNRINFRIMSAYTDEAIVGSICDPTVGDYDTYAEYEGDEDCF